MRSTGLSTPAFALFMFALAVSLHAVHLSSLASPGNSGPKTFYIYWNTSNSVFRIDNTDHIYDINKGNSRFEYDQMNIVCPVYQRGGPTNDDDTEKYIIYNVSKEEYETCRITNPNPRIIAVCDKPYKVMYFTITFRPFTPQPGGLEFLPGHDYYFISTSSREDLHRRVGGRCSTHNMKVLFKVWYPHDAEPSTSTAPPIIASQPSEPGGSWPPPPRSTPDAPALPASTTVPPPPPRPTKKKNKEFGADHPNDVGKRTWSSGGSQVAASLALVLVAAAVSLR